MQNFRRLGRVVEPKELAARWSFCEVTGRFSREYRDRHRDPDSLALLEKITAGLTFDELTDADHALLAAWFQTGFRSDFANAMRWYESFVCESWTAERLSNLCVIPSVEPDRRRLGALLSSPGRDELADPRAALALVPPGENFKHAEPLVVGHWDDGLQVLWEGYFRALLFLRSAKPQDEILLWVPHRGSWPHAE